MSAENKMKYIKATSKFIVKKINKSNITRMYSCIIKYFPVKNKNPPQCFARDL